MRLTIPLIAAALLTGACTATTKDGDKPIVAVTVPYLTDAVETVAGPGFEVVTVLRGSADAETYEPTPLVMGKVSEAAVLVEAGTLPFEASVRSAAGSGAAVVDMCGLTDLIHGTHGDAMESDPHVWASLDNMASLVGLLPQALAQAQPDSLVAFAERARTLQDKMAHMSRQADSLLAAAGRPAFGVWHPSLSYFARDFGLRQIAVGPEHRELTSRAVRNAVDSLRSAGAVVLFYDNPGQAPAATTIASEAGIPAMLLPTSTNTDSSALLEVAILLHQLACTDER